jgi:hypothetical protein
MGGPLFEFETELSASRADERPWLLEVEKALSGDSGRTRISFSDRRQGLWQLPR